MSLGIGLRQRGIPVMKRVAYSDAFLNDKMPPENEKIFLDQMAYGHDFYPSLAHQEVDEIVRPETTSIFSRHISTPDR